MFKGYKSIVFFLLVLAVAIANLFGFGDFQLSKDQLELLNVIVPLVGLILRYVTTSPVFQA